MLGCIFFLYFYNYIQSNIWIIIRGGKRIEEICWKNVTKMRFVSYGKCKKYLLSFVYGKFCLKQKIKTFDSFFSVKKVFVSYPSFTTIFEQCLKVTKSKLIQTFFLITPPQINWTHPCAFPFKCKFSHNFFITPIQCCFHHLCLTLLLFSLTLSH